jgi:hypothetical protein
MGKRRALNVVIPSLDGCLFERELTDGSRAFTVTAKTSSDSVQSQGISLLARRLSTSQARQAPVSNSHQMASHCVCFSFNAYFKSKGVALHCILLPRFYSTIQFRILT